MNPSQSDEAAGVLHPANLERYDARWLDPDPDVGDVVDQYWAVRWRMRPGEVIEQSIIDFPAITLTVEAGNVPSELVVTGVHDRAWHRSIAGTGAVFAIRLRPAGLAVLSTLPPQRFANDTVPLTPALDADLYSLMTRVAVGRSPEERKHLADGEIRTRLTERAPTASQLLANRVIDELRVQHHSTGSLAGIFGVSERTVQRSLARTMGIGPKRVANRIRLQRVAHAIATDSGVGLAALAIELGYTDQAHLTEAFRAATNTTPGAYRRSLAELSNARPPREGE